jgi:hypothetical protein
VGWWENEIKKVTDRMEYVQRLMAILLMVGAYD